MQGNWVKWIPYPLGYDAVHEYSDAVAHFFVRYLQDKLLAYEFCENPKEVLLDLDRLLWSDFRQRAHNEPEFFRTSDPHALLYPMLEQHAVGILYRSPFVLSLEEVERKLSLPQEKMGTGKKIDGLCIYPNLMIVPLPFFIWYGRGKYSKIENLEGDTYLNRFVLGLVAGKSRKEVKRLISSGAVRIRPCRGFVHATNW